MDILILVCLGCPVFVQVVLIKKQGVKTGRAMFPINFVFVLCYKATLRLWLSQTPGEPLAAFFFKLSASPSVHCPGQAPQGDNIASTVVSASVRLNLSILCEREREQVTTREI